ncbi:MAG: enoyl-CoA hydratase [Candidatus Hydrogenedentota bacterium]|nr:MAG: enoyl-CoA hydratase [Candidatus Hydrogenedentota bacterium]
MSEYSTLTLEYPEEQVALMTFNRPDRLNAITWEMVEEIHAVLTRMEEEPNTRVLIMTGAGRGFCSGTDLKADRDTSEPLTPNVSAQSRRQRRIADIPIHMRKIPQPIIAAVNGVAAGGGFSFAMACDVRVASKSARFIASYINIGLGAGEIGSSYFLPRLVGVSRASEILYTGRDVWGEEAERIGLVSKMVEDGEALNAALEVAHAMLGKSPFGLRMTKEVLNHSIDAPTLEAAIYMENRTQTLAVLTDDFQEAVKAFQGKRPPNFSKEG